MFALCTSSFSFVSTHLHIPAPHKKHTFHLISWISSQAAHCKSLTKVMKEKQRKQRVLLTVFYSTINRESMLSVVCKPECLLSWLFPLSACHRAFSFWQRIQVLLICSLLIIPQCDYKKHRWWRLRAQQTPLSVPQLGTTWVANFNIGPTWAQWDPAG